MHEVHFGQCRNHSSERSLAQKTKKNGILLANNGRRLRGIHKKCERYQRYICTDNTRTHRAHEYGEITLPISEVDYGFDGPYASFRVTPLLTRTHRLFNQMGGSRDILICKRSPG